MCIRDRSVTEGIKEIQHTLIEALVLVMIVVFVFLQGWRATLIPLLAVPVSLVGTFMLFPMFGFSINTLSLFGLVLAIGLVVDDAIVVVEAVEHHIEHGLSPKDATPRAMPGSSTHLDVSQRQLHGTDHYRLAGARRIGDRTQDRSRTLGRCESPLWPARMRGRQVAGGEPTHSTKARLNAFVLEYSLFGIATQ